MTTLTKSTHLLPLKTRIMRLISIILLGGGVIIAGVFAVTLLLNRLQQYQQSHQAILRDMSDEIESYIDDRSGQMVDVATSQTMGAFVLSVVEADTALTERDINLGITAFEQIELLLQAGGGDFRRAYVVVEGLPEIAYQFESDVVQADNSYTPETYGELTDLVLQGTVGEVLFTSMRVMGDEQVLTMATSIAHPADGSLVLGVLLVDVALDPILEVLANAPTDMTLGADSRRFVLLGGDTVLLDSEALRLNANFLPVEPIAIDTEFSQDFLRVYQENNGIIDFERVDGQYVSSVALPFSSVDNQNWQLAVIDLGQVVLGNTPSVATMSVLIILMMSGLLVVFMDRWLGRNLRVLSTSGRVIQQIKTDGGEEAIHKFLDTQELAVASTEEDVYILEGIRDLSSQVKNLRRQLDTQTTKYNTNFEVAAKVSREVARLTGLRELMQHTALILIEDFKLSYVQFLLLDSTKRYVTHIYGLDHRGLGYHNLNFRVDRQVNSLVVQALVEGIQIANDYTLHEPSPAEVDTIAKTRSRAVLPLRISNDVEVGALDLYADRPFAFKPEDHPSYVLIASQIASGVYKNRLLDEQVSRNEQLNAMNQKLTTMAISEVVTENALAESYRYQLATGEMQDAHEYKTADLLNIPIRVRGAQIGSIAVASPIETRLGDNDRIILNAVADRVGLAVENARLLQETQYNLTETEILYKTSSSLNQSDTMEDLVKSLFQSLTTDAYSGQVFIFDAYASESTPPEWAEVITSVYKDELINESSESQRLVGTRLKLSDYHFFGELNNSQVLIVENVLQDERVDHTLHYMLKQWGGGALVIIPLTVRGSWRGFIMINYLKPRTFSRREAEIIANLLGPIGVAMDNRLLLIQTNDALARNRRLYESSRIINQSQSLSDLIYGVQTTADLDDVEFMISVFEGEEHYEGWSVNTQLIAYSENGKINPLNQPYRLRVDENSPMRLGDYQVVLDAYPDQEPSNGWVHILRDLGFRYAVIFPLITSNTPVALFWVIRKEINELPERDTEVYQALSEQMSTVIQNRSLFEQTQSALSETRRLYEAGRAMSDASSPDEIYASAVQYLDIEAQSIHRISVWYPQPDLTAQAPYLLLIYPPTESDVLLPQSSQNLLSYMGNEQTRIFTTIEVFRDFEALYDYLAATQTNSVVIAQLRTRQNWFGVILIESTQIGVFTESYRRYAQAIADQVAVAVENNILFNEIQLEALQALSLAKASQIVSQVGANLQNGLTRLFEQISETGSFDRWLFVRYQNGVVTPIVLHNMGELPIQQGVPFLSLDDASHAIVDAILSRQTWLINRPASYPRYMNMPQWLGSLGKHLVTPVLSADGEVVAALMVGRGLNSPDLNEREETLITTLAAQLSVVLENQQLYTRAESERVYLDSILTTLPAGVLVLDGQSLIPIQTNARVAQLLGREVETNQPFTAERYQLYRTGTQLFYVNEEFPALKTRQTDKPTFVDDVTLILPDGKKRDLLLNAAPLHKEDGSIASIILTFEDISSLRSLENSLQETLRDQATLYEATRSFAEVTDLDEIVDVLFTQLKNIQEMTDVHIAIMNPQTNQLKIERAHQQPLRFEQFPAALFVKQKPVFLENVLDASLLSPDDRERLEALGYGSLAVVPLVVSQSEEPFGWFMLSYDQPRSFPSNFQSFLNTLSDNASISIDNRLLFQSTNVALNETTKLYRATNAISQSADLETLSDALMEALSDIHADFFVAFIQRGGTQGRFVELAKSPDVTIPNLHDLIKRYNLIEEDEAYIADIETTTEETPFTRFARELNLAYPMASLAMVNLRVRSIPDGLILIASNKPFAYTVDERRLLSATSNSASLVMDNIFLLDQVQESLEETSTLYQSSKAISQSSDVDEILEVIVERIISPSINQVFIALLDGSSWEGNRVSVRIQASWQRDSVLDLHGISLTSEQFPAWKQLSSRTILTINDITEDPSLTELERLGIESLDTRALAILPIYTTSRDIGSIWISSNEPYNFTDREERIYQAFVEQVSLSMESSFLIEQTEKRARQLETSAQVSQRVSSVLDLDELLPDIVNIVREQFSYDHVQVFLLDDEEEFAVLRASTGEAGQQLLSIRHKLQVGSASVIGQVTQNAEPTIALDTADARVIHRPNPYLPLTRSELALPIIAQGRVIGALDVQSNQPNAFDQDDVGVLGTLASQLAVAIENARLFNEAESRADEMSFLFTLTTAAASAESLNIALQNVADLLMGTLQELNVCIYLVYPHATDTTLKVLRPVAVAGPDNSTLPALSQIPEAIVGDENNVVGFAALDSIPSNIENVVEDTSYIPISPMARSAIVMPLNAGPAGGSSDNIGVVTVESTRFGAFKQEGLTVLLALSNSLSNIIQSSRYYEELQETYQQLKELDRLKSDFLANMSHELRTPLNSIIGFSRVMIKGIDGPLTEMQEQDLNTIYNSGQHLLGLINDILDQAKIAADKMSLDKEYFDIAKVVDGVRSIGIGLVKEKPVDIIVNMAKNLPSAYGDEFRTRQVLLNLVSNSAKFTLNGTITISAYLQRSPNGQEMVRVDVADTGIGIAEKDIPTLFEAFRQVDSSLTRTVGGTGLGLPIAKSLVELQGGEMFVQSKVGIGSIFSITLPLGPVEVSETITDEADDDYQPSMVVDQMTFTQIPSLSEGLSVPPPGLFQQKRQVLLIEDNPNMVDQYRRTLQGEGFEVLAASIQLEAEAMASGLRPTLIVMDVNFANGQGWKILETLKDRDDTFDIPVIVCTLNDESERAFQLGAYEFLSRPIMPEDLVKAVLSAEKDSNIDRVLIIDDQPSSTRLLEQALLTAGQYRVFAAHTGPEGIALVARRRPDLIILDLRMPEMDGFRVLEELRSHPESAKIPVIVVTSDSNLTNHEREQLVNLDIIYKTDLNQDNYQTFINEVRRQIARYNGE